MLNFHARLERVSQFKNLFIVSYSPTNLFEQIPRTTNRTCGSWLRQLILQGQAGPSESVPPLWYPPPQEITMNTYIPTHWHSKALSGTSGAKIQFHAVCQLLSLLVKEKLLTVFHCCVVRETCVCSVRMCVERVWCLSTRCVPSCLWSVCTLILSRGKLPHINFWETALIYSWSDWLKSCIIISIPQAKGKL